MINKSKKDSLKKFLSALIITFTITILSKLLVLFLESESLAEAMRYLFSSFHFNLSAVVASIVSGFFASHDKEH